MAPPLWKHRYNNGSSTMAPGCNEGSSHSGPIDDPCLLVLNCTQGSTLHWTVQCYTTQCSITLHNAALHFTIQHYTAQSSTTLHNAALHCTVQHYTAQCSTTLHNAALHCTMQHYTAQCSTVLPRLMLSTAPPPYIGCSN